MSLEIARFFIISLPEMFFCLLAALILLGEDMQKDWSKVFYISVLSALVTLSTYNYVKISLLKNAVDFLFLLAALKVFSKMEWPRAIKIVSLFIIITLVVTVAAMMISVYWYKLPVSQMQNDIGMWIKIMWPLFVLSILIAYLLRPLRTFILLSFAKFRHIADRIPYFRSVLLAIIVQILLIISYFVQFFLDPSYYNNVNFVFAFFVILVVINIYILIKLSGNIEKKIIAQGQEAISGNIMGLINSVRSQRHDFVNNLQVITSLVHTGDKEALKEYLSQLNDSVSFYNDMLKINEPIISALLNAKLAQAEVKGIKVKTNVDANLSKLSTRAFDITRILGNLLDNALDAVAGNQKQDRWIRLDIEEKGPFLFFSITNPGTLPREIRDKMFTPGFTTKDSSHSGLGLYICKQLAEKLGGKIQLTNCSESDTTFSLVLPKP